MKTADEGMERESLIDGHLQILASPHFPAQLGFPQLILLFSFFLSRSNDPGVIHGAMYNT